VHSLFIALGLVFVAELGDKTQLVALGFGARHRLAPVLTGVVLAYMATNLLSVVIGGLLGAALPTRAIGLVGGARSSGSSPWGRRSSWWCRWRTPPTGAPSSTPSPPRSRCWRPDH